MEPWRAALACQYRPLTGHCLPADRRLNPWTEAKFGVPGWGTKKNPSIQEFQAGARRSVWSAVAAGLWQRSVKGAGRAIASLHIPRRTRAPAKREIRKPDTYEDFSRPRARMSTRQTRSRGPRWRYFAWRQTRKAASWGQAPVRFSARLFPVLFSALLSALRLLKCPSFPVLSSLVLKAQDPLRSGA